MVRPVTTGLIFNGPTGAFANRTAPPSHACADTARYIQRCSSASENMDGVPLAHPVMPPHACEFAEHGVFAPFLDVPQIGPYNNNRHTPHVRLISFLPFLPTIMSRITITIDVPTDDLAERLENLTVNFSPKKPASDGKASSAKPATFATSASSRSTSGDGAVTDDDKPVKPERQEDEQDPWEGETWAVFKAVQPGVYRVEYEKFPTYGSARKAFNEAKRRGDTCPYSKSWDKKTEHGLPPR
ncbi:hypothetical protein FA95DRAFT_1578034 [Auriscalpium vulgare]|uniref:Uncharacterized protein n=1 Tax=Auriscalpium vulgare TaxID=40419 RepID=A0ACB8R4C5_9AGAM|nr:hypothetical protein FA95DRAFT_1578034 [Auriscalpium vulgare]